jgi:hydroxymethylpyrimidine pyrophosphatase-like HAD family hydrolase
MDRIRLIASDMDATLLDEYSQLPPKFTETIRALAGQGILFAAASGRPLYTLETMFPDLLEEIILIGDNGGAARWKGKDLFVSDACRGLAAAGPQHKAGWRRGPFVRTAGSLRGKAGREIR